MEHVDKDGNGVQVPRELLAAVGRAIADRDLEALTFVSNQYPKIVFQKVPFTVLGSFELEADFGAVCMWNRFPAGLALALDLGLHPDALVEDVPNDEDSLAGERPRKARLIEIAVRGKNFDAVKILIGRGVDLAVTDAAGNSPLVAAWSIVSKDAKQVPIMNALIDAGAPWKSHSTSKRSPVPTIAISLLDAPERTADALALIQRGLASGWDINGTNSTKPGSDTAFTGIGAALATGTLDVCLALIRAGADVTRIHGDLGLLETIDGTNKPFWVHANAFEWGPVLKAEIMKRAIAPAQNVNSSPSVSRSRIVL